MTNWEAFVKEFVNPLNIGHLIENSAKGCEVYCPKTLVEFCKRCNEENYKSCTGQDYNAPMAHAWGCTDRILLWANKECGEPCGCQGKSPEKLSAEKEENLNFS